MAKSLEEIKVLRGHLREMRGALQSSLMLSAGRDLMADGAKMNTAATRSILTMTIERQLERLNGYLAEDNGENEYEEITEGRPNELSG